MRSFLAPPPHTTHRRCRFGMASLASQVQRRVLDLLIARNFQQALKLLNSLLQKHPNNEILRLNRASTYLELKQYQECIDDCRIIHDNDPFDMRAVLYLGQALHGVGQHHAALKYLTEARQIHADINYHRELESLITSINAGLVSDAPSPEAESLTDHSESPDQTVVPALTPVPDDVYPSIDKSHAICIGPADRIALGYMEVNSGKYDAAIDSFSQLVQTDCETYLALCGRGSAFALKHDFDAAIADFTRAIEYDDSKADAYKRRGQALAACGRLKEAIRDISRATEFGGSVLRRDSDLFQQRALMYFRLNDLDKAMADFKLSIGLEPRNKACWNFMGLIYARQGDFAESLSCFDKVITLDSRAVDAHLNAARSCQELGLVDNALQLFAKSLAILPDQPEVLTHRGWLQLKQGSFGLSIDDFTRCLTLPGMHLSAIHGLAVACFSMGNFDKSQTAFFDLFAKDSENIVIYQFSVIRQILEHLDVKMSDWNITRCLPVQFWELYSKKSPASSLLKSNFYKPITAPFEVVNIQTANLTTIQLGLIEHGDQIGSVLVGLSPNTDIVSSRTKRMFGLAVLHMSQLIRRATDSRGFVMSGLSSSDDHTMHQLGWRDLIDVFVAWRTLAEPNERTIWLDKLDDETVSEGFALQTPLIHGALKTVRTAPYLPRALELAKLLVSEQCNVDCHDVSDVGGLYDSIGEDVVVYSDIPLLRPDFDKLSDVDENVTGISITLMELEPDSHLFSVSTPSPPLRWMAFDEQLESIFSVLKEQLEDMQSDSSQHQSAYIDNCLALYYYLTNFGPLSHASSLAATACLVAFLQAANISMTSSNLNGCLLEWEAYLAGSPQSFVDQCHAKQFPQVFVDSNIKSFHFVEVHFPTVRSACEALVSL